MSAQGVFERVSVSHTAPDATVQRVLDRIDHEVLVGDALGADGVQGVIASQARRTTRAPFSLDLIGHARRGVLQLGNWPVDGNAIWRALREACVRELAELPLVKIRLLGCNTALTVDGQAAMRRLHGVFRVPVEGSKVPLSARQFDGGGFLADAVLTDQDHLPPPAQPTLQAAEQWLADFEPLPGQTIRTLADRLRRESLSDTIRDWTRTLPQLRWPIRQVTRAQLDGVLAHAMSRPVLAPGLLALPELELVSPIADGFGAPRYHRVTVLMDGYWLRLYPRDHPEGVVLATEATPELTRALRQGGELIVP